jgi:hypothetical protein
MHVAKAYREAHEGCRIPKAESLLNCALKIEEAHLGTRRAVGDSLWWRPAYSTRNPVGLASAAVGDNVHHVLLLIPLLNLLFSYYQ